MPWREDATQNLISADGKADEIFVAANSPRELLCFNATDAEKHAGTLTLASHSIASQKLGAP